MATTKKTKNGPSAQASKSIEQKGKKETINWKKVVSELQKELKKTKAHRDHHLEYHKLRKDEAEKYFKEKIELEKEVLNLNSIIEDMKKERSLAHKNIEELEESIIENEKGAKKDAFELHKKWLENAELKRQIMELKETLMYKIKAENHLLLVMKGEEYES